MIARTATIALLAALALSACGGQQSLPVSIRRCDAVILPHGFTVNASVRSDATKPISGLRVVVEFYQNFRYSHFVAGAKLPHELDPGESKDVVMTVTPSGNQTIAGKAMRCYATHIDYLDGTSEDLRNQPVQ